MIHHRCWWWWLTWILLLLCDVETSSALCQPLPSLPPPPSHQPQHQYIVLYKPALTLCTLRDDQERAERKHRDVRSTLSDQHFNLPSGLHMCGRLDRDSEGLLLLTNDGQFTSQVCEPDQPHKVAKRYLARVRNIPDETALQRMRQGGLIIRGATTRPPVSVSLLLDDDNNNNILQWLPKPVSGMEDRKGSYAWVEIVLTEGRNRQVRRITADAGHPTVRLIRVAIGSLALGDLATKLPLRPQPGQWCSISKEDVLGGR